jgi:hypothetical protein
MLEHVISADVKMTRRGNKPDAPVGEDDSFAAVANSGATCGNQGIGPTRNSGALDSEANGLSRDTVRR